MTISDWVMILAIFLGPIIAVQLSKYIDSNNEKRERKLDIFKILMATRAYTISWDHVMTLNRIDLEFDKSHPKEKEVINAWKQYHDLLSTTSITAEQWEIKRVDLMVELLHKMALVLEYDFDKTHIKNSSYSPIAHVKNEDDLVAIRKGLIDILGKKDGLPMFITNWPSNDKN